MTNPISSRVAPAMAGMADTHAAQPQAGTAAAPEAGDDFEMVDAEDAQERFAPRVFDGDFEVISIWEVDPPRISIDPKDLKGLQLNGQPASAHQLAPIQQFGKILQLALLTPQTAEMDTNFPPQFHKLIGRLEGFAEKLPNGTPAFRDQLLKELTHNFMGEFKSEAQCSDFKERMKQALATQQSLTPKQQAILESLDQAIQSCRNNAGETGKAHRLASEKITGKTLDVLKGLLAEQYKGMPGLLKKHADALKSTTIDPGLHSAVAYKAFELAFAEFSETDRKRLVALNNHPAFKAAMSSAEDSAQRHCFALNDALLNMGARTSTGEFNDVFFMRDYLRLHPSAQVEGMLPEEFSNAVLAQHDVIDRSDYA